MLFRRRHAVLDEFTLPLSRALLADPAFSPDPRAHPHATPSHTPPPPQPAALHPPPSPPSPSPSVFSIPKLPLRQKAPAPDKPSRKRTMKALVRRLTGRRNLDRIDELDETDPFGASYHHDGPYEAIAHNVAYPTLPFPDPGSTLPRAHRRHPTPKFDPRSLQLGQPQSTSGVSQVEMGLSLHLEPGQILQPSTVYPSHASTMAHLPSRPGSQPPMATRIARSDHSRTNSLPRPWTHSPRDSPSRDLTSITQRPTSLQHPRERHFKIITPDIPDDPPPHHDRNAAPYALRQREITVFPPPRYESRFHSPVPPRSSQPPSTSSDAHSTRSTVPSYASKHNSVDESHVRGTTPPSIRDRPPDFARMRHVPKRLVMPSLLQPQQSQSQHNVSSPDPLDDRDLEVSNLKGRPAVQVYESRVLRKRSSTFPAHQRIPNHAPTSQDATMPITANPASKTATDAADTKEKARRRKLSKRKNDG